MLIPHRLSFVRPWRSSKSTS